jgi:hypothetical protein
VSSLHRARFGVPDVAGVLRDGLEHSLFVVEGHDLGGAADNYFTIHDACSWSSQTAIFMPDGGLDFGADAGLALLGVLPEQPGELLRNGVVDRGLGPRAAPALRISGGTPRHSIATSKPKDRS